MVSNLLFNLRKLYRFLFCIILIPVSSLEAQTLDFEFDRKKPIEITANQLEVADNKKTGKFIGKVEITQGDYQLNADLILVEYMDAKKEANLIKQITAIGNVFLFSKAQQAAKAQKAIYNLKTKILTLSDQVLITYDNNTLSGDEISVNTQTRYIKVSGNENERIRALLVLPEENGKIKTNDLPTDTVSQP